MALESADLGPPEVPSTVPTPAPAQTQPLPKPECPKSLVWGFCLFAILVDSKATLKGLRSEGGLQPLANSASCLLACPGVKPWACSAQASPLHNHLPEEARSEGG